MSLMVSPNDTRVGNKVNDGVIEENFIEKMLTYIWLLYLYEIMLLDNNVN